MDPLSQAVVGSALPASFSREKNVRLAVLCGALGGLAPDLDVLIRSSVDPFLSLEYHRHFTHSLLMAPIVGFVVSFFIWLIFSRNKTEFRVFYLFTTLGVLTHGALDTCTSYGTYLLWPFSDVRLTWMNMSIIDPLFTLPMLVIMFMAIKFKKAYIAMLALIYGLAYIGLSQYNLTLVKARVEQEALKRGHEIDRMFFNPTIGNNIVWRTIYEADGRYYVDGVRSIPFKGIQFFEGVHVPKINPHKIYPEIADGSQQRKDILRFNKFAFGFLYEYEKNVLADLRYGMLVNTANPLWGIKVNPNTPQKHAERFVNRGDRREALNKIKALVFYGKGEDDIDNIKNKEKT